MNDLSEFGRFLVRDLLENDVLFEFVGGPLDGFKVNREDWHKDQRLPSTDILDKRTASLYRYHLTSSNHHAVYTFRQDG